MSPFTYLWFIVIFEVAYKTQQDAIMSDLNSLSQLPLDKLLMVKNSLEPEVVTDDRARRVDDVGELPEAQALHGKFNKLIKKKPFQRGGYETSGWQKKGGGKKGISTIFQISITALAFLAFGGYLLCLLVQALKSKQSASMTDSMMMVAAPLRKRRPIYRTRREAIWPESDPDTLYQALRMFSEGYATYHTVDYKYYNFTVNSLT